MITLKIILIMLAVVLMIALAVSLRGNYQAVEDDYRDHNGDHVYYDESIIEKKQFSRLHPKEAVRTLARLFCKKW